jgi:predicted Zn-dependent protease
MDRERCREILSSALSASRADETEVNLTGGEQALTRFANNAIHQNVLEEGYTLSVRTVLGKRTNRAATNRLDPDGIREVVARALDGTKLTPEDPDLLPVPGPASYRAIPTWDEATARLSPAERATRVKRVLDRAVASDLTAAGFLANGFAVTAVANSAGLFAWHRETQASFSTTCFGPDSSGWVQDAAPSIADIDVDALAERAIQKALASRSPKPCPAGSYTVVLEPAALTDLLAFLLTGFGGRLVHEKQSFLTDRVGTKLFGENVTIKDDVYHSGQFGLPFDGEGVPRESVPLVRKGVVENLVYDRLSAKKMEKRPTGHGYAVPNTVGAGADNLVMEGGSASFDDLVRGVKRGILVTRFWYNRLVEPMQVVVTGMTRDGTFLIEDGEVRHGIRNFRYDQGVVALLNSIEEMTAPVRASGVESPTMIVPAVRVRDFRFQSETRF